MHLAGIDYHKQYSLVTAVSEEGQVIITQRLNNESERFREILGA